MKINSQPIFLLMLLLAGSFVGCKDSDPAQQEGRKIILKSALTGQQEQAFVLTEDRLHYLPDEVSTPAPKLLDSLWKEFDDKIEISQTYFGIQTLRSTGFGYTLLLVDQADTVKEVSYKNGLPPIFERAINQFQRLLPQTDLPIRRGNDQFYFYPRQPKSLEELKALVPGQDEALPRIDSLGNYLTHQLHYPHYLLEVYPQEGEYVEARFLAEIWESDQPYIWEVITSIDPETLQPLDYFYATGELQDFDGSYAWSTQKQDTLWAKTRIEEYDSEVASSTGDISKLSKREYLYLSPEGKYETIRMDTVEVIYVE